MYYSIQYYRCIYQKNVYVQKNSNSKKKIKAYVKFFWKNSQKKKKNCVYYIDLDFQSLDSSSNSSI